MYDKCKNTCFQFWLHFLAPASNVFCFYQIWTAIVVTPASLIHFSPSLSVISNFCNPTYKNEKLGCVSNLKVLVQCQGESQNWRFPTFSVHFVMVQLKRGTLSNAQGLFSSLSVTQSLINSSSGGFFCLFVCFYFYGNYNTPLLLLFWRSHISRNHFLMRSLSKSVECPGLHCGRTVKSCLFNCYGYIWL